MDDDDGSPKHSVLFTMLHLLHKNGAFQFAQVISFSCVISACARCGNGSKQSNYSWGNPTKGWPWLLANQTQGEKWQIQGFCSNKNGDISIYILYMYRYSLLLFVWIARGLIHQWLKWRGIVCHVDQEPLISCVSCWAKKIESMQQVIVRPVGFDPAAGFSGILLHKRTKWALIATKQAVKAIQHRLSKLLRR